ncbi:Stearoyl-CoA desaturase 5 [Araneus ventricosus]|uniref:Stearoyl-CoA desaturase 5 n=1 Tax=Araneus ventricosus TaxID=182803 RepID=A0A4Y2QL29_ARAVE|nr:Stearoyl-CoA desaturase 5 [Araneus ventricosus]
MIPSWCWGETVWNLFFIAAMARYCVSLNGSWLVNSAAHKYGDQPFDKYIEARENPGVALLKTGEGWHNYHRVFPWDYANSELGYTLNLTKMFIDVMAMIGLAYDLKTANPDAIKERKLKSGDGTRVTFTEKPKHTLNTKYTKYLYFLFFKIIQIIKQMMINEKYNACLYYK